MIYLKSLLLALVVIYIVDLSGFTPSWRGFLSRLLKVKALRRLPPFDCGQCMTWWSCLIYTAVCGELSIFTIAYSALLAFLSIPLGQMLCFIRESLITITNKLIQKISI